MTDHLIDISKSNIVSIQIKLSIILKNSNQLQKDQTLKQIAQNLSKSKELIVLNNLKIFNELIPLKNHNFFESEIFE